MNIEVKFRDFKSLLGLRALKLKVSRAEKLSRLLLCISIVYIILVNLGGCDLAQKLRLQIEIKRRKKGIELQKHLAFLLLLYL